MKTTIQDELGKTARRSNSHRGYTGLGIGLTLVKQIVEMHHGTVNVFSEGHETGSEFTVSLPILTPLSAINTADIAENLSSHHRIMVVDDNRDPAKLLAMVLNALGNETCVSHNGEEALHTAQTYLPSIIIMDLGMPVMDGYEAARQIRLTDWGKNIVLVALTGWGQAEDRHKTRLAGFDFHLVKPVLPSDLQKLLNTLITS